MLGTLNPSIRLSVEFYLETCASKLGLLEIFCMLGILDNADRPNLDWESKNLLKNYALCS